MAESSHPMIVASFLRPMETVPALAFSCVQRVNQRWQAECPTCSRSIAWPAEENARNFRNLSLTEPGLAFRLFGFTAFALNELEIDLAKWLNGMACGGIINTEYSAINGNCRIY